MIERLRTRAIEPWPCVRDLVFSYRAGERDPYDFEAALPGLEVAPIADAIFAKLAPGRALPAFERVDGQTYDWGEDAAAISPEGDGILVANYVIPESERERDGGRSRTVYHAVVGEDACVMVANESRAQRVANPRFVVQLSATADAIDAVTDAVLEVAPGFGLGLVERVDVPVRVVRPRRPRAAVRAFERVLACDSKNKTADEFAWIVIGMMPAWFDFAPDTFAVEGGDSAISLVWMHANRRAIIRLSSSRNIDCLATVDGATVDRGKMGMHYTPSAAQYENARLTLWCALRWLGQRVEVPAEILARIRPGRVFLDPRSD